MDLAQESDFICNEGGDMKIHVRFLLFQTFVYDSQHVQSCNALEIPLKIQFLNISVYVPLKKKKDNVWEIVHVELLQRKQSLLFPSCFPNSNI